MNFEWDSKKAASNLAKHGVSLDDALTVFADPLARIFDDEDHSSEERRSSANGRLLVVCFTAAQPESIRIFSARNANKRERKDYEENVKP